MNLREEMKYFAENEDGVGVIELVLILTVLIGLVLIFKKQINQLLDAVFRQINAKSREIYG